MPASEFVELLDPVLGVAITVPEDQVVETLLKHAQAMAAELREEVGGDVLAGTSPAVLTGA